MRVCVCVLGTSSWFNPITHSVILLQLFCALHYCTPHSAHVQSGPRHKLHVETIVGRVHMAFKWNIWRYAVRWLVKKYLNHWTHISDYVNIRSSVYFFLFVSFFLHSLSFASFRTHLTADDELELENEKNKKIYNEISLASCSPLTAISCSQRVLQQM